MNHENAIPLLKAIIAREEKDGCPMATKFLIEPALCRWKTYDRRFKRHKRKSLDHLAHDLEKGLIESIPDFGYDRLCIRHLARSFAEVLFEGATSNPANGHYDM